MGSPSAWVKHDVVLDSNEGVFVVAPLARGMGTTIGNAMRRVLLSSLSGVAVTYVRFKGVTHEFSSLPNVVEDVLDIICNLKGVVFKSNQFERCVVKLSSDKPTKLFAKDIACDPSMVEVVNSDHYIAEVTDDSGFDLELTLEAGEGYGPASAQSSEYVDSIAIDASFSPVVSVNYSVSSIRVGDKLGYDKLTLTVVTDGSDTPEGVVKRSSDILLDKFDLFNHINEEPENAHFGDDVELSASLQSSILDMSVEDLELSARSSNCLKRAGIETVKDLVEKNMSELINIKNFGAKSAGEINDKLRQYNLSLKDDVSEA